MSTPTDIMVETTADGSPTLYLPEIDEHYHSVKGALTESEHVYITCGWGKASDSRRKLRVFEVGFGTGLNAVLTALAAEKSKIDTDYISVELHPLPPELNDAIAADYGSEIAEIMHLVSAAPWNRTIEISTYFKLHKIEGDLLSIALPENIDIVFFDAFAPEKQPEMWSEAIFLKFFSAMAPGGILTTYCAKGAVRRLLEQVGFKVERLEGPPGGKREILRATKPAI